MKVRMFIACLYCEGTGFKRDQYHDQEHRCIDCGGKGGAEGWVDLVKVIRKAMEEIEENK